MSGIARPGLVGVVLATSMAVAGFVTTQSTTSFLYDLETVRGEFTAGEWAVIPAACDDVLKHPHTTIITGTPGNDTLPDPGGTASPGGDDDKPNFSQVVLGLAGDDVLFGGNQDDCLVGGSGNDQLGGVGHENGKDILLGGEGDDHLVSGNGKDVLDGGPGDNDICEGENGKDTFLDCEQIVENGPDPGSSKSSSTTSSAESSSSGVTSPLDDEPKQPDTDDGSTPTGSDVTEPDATDPEVKEPEVAEPEVPEPEVVTETEAADPEGTEPPASDDPVVPDGTTGTSS